MYTCNTGPCRAVGEIVKADLRPIGIAVTVHRFAFPAVFDRERAPRARYDIGWFGWFADYAASFGPDAVVLDPPDLREAVIRRLKGVLA